MQRRDCAGKGAWQGLSAVLCAACLLLAACAGSSAAPTQSHAPTPARTVRAPATSPKKVGLALPGQSLAISLLLKRRAPDELARILAGVNDPNSPLYHHYLTPRQIAERFGADPTSVARAEDALRKAGLTDVAQSTDAARLDARGTVAQLDALFSTTLDEYSTASGGISYAPERLPVLPPALAGVATGVLGLDTRTVVHGGALFGPQRVASPQVSGVSGLTPTDLARAYDIGPLRSAGLDGSGQTVALPEIDTFNTSDVQSYDRAFGISPGPLQVVRVGRGASGRSPEPVLDIELVHAVAPKAAILVYEGRQDLQSVANIFNQIVNDNKAQVVSISLGACERGLDQSIASAFFGALNDTFQRAQAQGMSVLVASGDNGAYDCGDDQLSVGAVAANPFVTAVGGTALFLGQNGGYGREAGWEGPLEGAGGGGGVSTFYPQPSWQVGPGVRNQYSQGMRQVPDVAAAADPATGYAIYYGGWHVVGGTSGATPLWASLILLANQQAKSPLGFLDPALYRIGASDNGRVFHDVTLGGNLYYNAATNWDYSTGWGSPDAAQLVPALLANR